MFRASLGEVDGLVRVLLGQLLDPGGLTTLLGEGVVELPLELHIKSSALGITKQGIKEKFLRPETQSSLT